MLYFNRLAIGGVYTSSDDGSWYWSSSENEVNVVNAWVQDFEDGSQGFGDGRHNTNRVRAVRAF
jgi:hypothetical protein